MVMNVYSHGYAVIPDDIISVATRIASRAYQAGLKAADMGAVPGISATTLGDYSVSFGGGTAEGVLGASAAPLLLQSEKELLDKYRV
jgi:hypothetical protein